MNAYISLANPAQLNNRIGHTLQISKGFYDHSVIRKVQRGVGFSKPERIFAVVHRAKKGPILDRFSIEIDGEPASALPLVESRALTSIALTHRYFELLEDSGALLADDLWYTILTGVLSEFPTTSESEGWRESHSALPVRLIFEDSLAAMKARLEANPRYSDDKVYRRDVRTFTSLVKELAANQLIWTEIPGRGHSHNEKDGLAVHSEIYADRWARIVVRYAALQRTEWGTSSEAIRMKLGLMPKKVGMDLPLAGESHSYHLEVMAPDGMYFYDLKPYLAENAPIGRAGYLLFDRLLPNSRRTRASLSRIRRWLATQWNKLVQAGKVLRTILMNDQGDSDILTGLRRLKDERRNRVSAMLQILAIDVSPSFRCNERGFSSAHIYTRAIANISMSKSANPDGSSVVPHIRWELRERPPGILLPAILLSIYVTSLVWVVGLLDGVFDSEKSGSAVLFGIPAILSAWVLSKFTGDHVERASMISLITVGWTVLNTLATTLGALALISQLEPWAFTFPGGMWWPINILHGVIIGDIIWPSLMLLTGMNLIVLIVMSIARMGRFAVRRTGRIDLVESQFVTQKVGLH